MKECEDSDDSFTNLGNNMFERPNPALFGKQGDFISPFNSEKKDNNNISNMSYSSNPNINNNYSCFRNNQNFYNNLDDYQFERVNLTDEQKRYLQPKDCSFIDKILDFFFNW